MKFTDVGKPHQINGGFCFTLLHENEVDGIPQEKPFFLRCELNDPRTHNYTSVFTRWTHRFNTPEEAADFCDRVAAGEISLDDVLLDETAEWGKHYEMRDNAFFGEVEQFFNRAARLGVDSSALPELLSAYNGLSDDAKAFVQDKESVREHFPPSPEPQDLLTAYGKYIAQAAEHQLFGAGWTPRTPEEFHQKEYASVWSEAHDFTKYFSEAAEMMSKSVSAHDLAVAIDNFYYAFDTYEYKDQIDNREEAISDIEVDLNAGVFDYMLERLKNDMEEYDQVDSISLAADLLSAQLKQHGAYREAMGIQEQREQDALKELEALDLSGLPLGSSDRLVLQTEKPDVIEIGCYPDQVLPQTDIAEIIDGFYGAYFVVSREWAEEQAKAAGYADLEEFQSDYTWDTTDGWYEQAFHEGALLGVSLGALPYHEKEIQIFPQRPGKEQGEAALKVQPATLEEKLAKARETVQTNLPDNARSGSERT